MGPTAFVRRHRRVIASGAALALTAGLVVAYAFNAEGYKRHQTDLNDGGVWVVNGDKGIHGRINKPINQLDGVVYDDGPKLSLDVVQEGAAVLTFNRGSNSARGVDPGLLQFEDTTVSLPDDGDVQMGGGTLASVDAASGKLWATRFDPQAGKALLATVDVQSDETATAGEAAALAVSADGTVVATSGVEETVTVLRPKGEGFAEPVDAGLPGAAGSPTSVTTVGEHVITLDAASGQLAVLDGPQLEVPEGSVLQQPGPDADTVLVATPEGLRAIDLSNGDEALVAEGSGQPVEPVRLGACAYGAWSGGRGMVAQQCGADEGSVRPLGGQATNLAFRVNRGAIVLNDSTSGRVWDISSDKPFKIDNWESFTAKKKVKEEDEQDEKDDKGDRRPPKAVDDSFGIRPARTTILHPLDNDSAPAGRLLSIVAVDQPGGGARVTIGPDGQTVQVAAPETARPVNFDYYIDDGHNLQAHATINLDVRTAGENEAPVLRTGYEPRQWHVPAGGSMSLPVLSDWRDPSDGDALVLDSAEVIDSGTNGAEARSTSDGRIRFTAAPRGGGAVKVRYAVSDGRSAPVERTMVFEVQPATEREGFAPIAEPDVIRGEVDRSIEIRPLANDLPGSDPTTPQAELALGGRIAAQANVDVTSDLENGVVDFRAEKPGTYFLDYDAAYGNAPMSKGRVRIDVRPKARRPEDPVAMPDTLMVYGQAAASIDVLANDLDAAGNLLVVHQTMTDNADQLDLAIVDGRWLRVAARGRLTPATQIVRYTITNGLASATGEVTVTQREEPANNAPITVADRVLVRAGSAAIAPVLDNDASPSGDRLSLSNNVTDAAGELDVQAPRGLTGDAGRAFVSGRMVRFVAPEVAERETFVIPYIAVNTMGESTPGRLHATVVPLGARNSRPEPPTLEGRALAGDVVTVKLPGSGIDPDGDPVAITGITSAPKFGRLLSYTANSLRYQAYPGSAGTDEFEYSVVDTHGAVARGVARVAVAPASAPQPPLAVDDELVVQPGRVATFDPLANDHFLPGESPRVTLVNPTPGMEVDESSGLVTIPAPSSLEEPAVQVVYSLSNGFDETRATLTLRTAEDAENPPVVHDAYGRLADSEVVAVDVLGGAYDPDGDAGDVRVAEVYAEPEIASHTDSKVRVSRTESPQVIAFRVEDADGTSASAQVFIPPAGYALPYVSPDALIELAVGGSARGRLSDFIVNPGGGQLRLVGPQSTSASPGQLSAQGTGDDSFEVSSGAGYRGPGALLVAVTATQDSDNPDDASAGSEPVSVLLSIPVQVGTDTPVLECPTMTLPISAGEENVIDVQSVCKVWTLDPRDAPDLDYTGTWDSPVEGLALESMGGSVFRVRAAESAASGGDAVLSLRAGRSNTQRITFRLARAPQPRMLPVPLRDVKAGEARTLDLAPFLVPGVSDPSPRVISLTQISGDRSPASSSGSSVTLRPPSGVTGRVAYRVVMSDIDSDDPPAQRRAESRLTFDVRGVPGAPLQPTPYPDDRTGKMRVGWYAPKETGGLPIQHYQVMELRNDTTRICRQNECFFPGLKSGIRYRFKVRARNAVGYGPWSEQSKEAYVDTRPSSVRSIRMASRGDGTITIAWKKPSSTNSRITKYAVSWEGGTGLEITGDRERAVIPGLDNNRSYTFSVQALNDVGWSDARESDPMQPLGTPAPPTEVTATDLNTGNAATSVRIDWTATSPQGPGPTRYIVYVSRSGGSPRTVPGCDRIEATTCTDRRDYDGNTYIYSVRALNSPDPEPANRSTLSQGAAFEAVGKPAAWGNWSWAATGKSQEVQLRYNVPDSRGSVSRVEVLVEGAPVETFGNQRGDGVVSLAKVASNERGWPVQLRVCNEHAPVGCTTSPTQNVQSYGDLSASLDDIAPPVVNGRTITWTVTGTSNGNPAVLDVSLDGQVPQTIRLDGVGRFSLPMSFTTQDYKDSARITARLYDDAPGQRGSDSADRTDESGGPPPPALSAWKEGSCNDGDEADDNQCWQPGAPIWDPDPICDVVSCGYVHYKVEGFISNYACEVTNDQFPGHWASNRHRYTHVGGAPAEQQTHWYYPRGQVTVKCFSGGKYAQEVSASFSWPP